MFANMTIYCTKGIIQKINVCAVIDGSSKGNSLFLTSTEVNTLQCKQNAQLQTHHHVTMVMYHCSLVNYDLVCTKEYGMEHLE
jgi:hypothetical protein